MSKYDGQIEVVVRGVCVSSGQLLYCRSKGDENTYLPGGHVEFNEPAREALRREIDEEMGVPARAGRFLGSVEHTFMQKGKRHCEVNLVFEFEIDGLKPGKQPKSREEKLEFDWVPLEQLADTPLVPAPLRELIPVWLSAPLEKAPWASTF